MLVYIFTWYSDVEFEDPAMLVEIVQELAEGVTTALGKPISMTTYMYILNF